MPVSATLSFAEIARLLDDWGVTLTFRQVTSEFDPTTQQVAEETADTVLEGIVGGTAAEPAAATAGQYLGGAVSFFVRADDLPAGSPATTDRILFQGEEYELTAFHLAADGTLYELKGRRR